MTTEKKGDLSGLAQLSSSEFMDVLTSENGSGTDASKGGSDGQAANAAAKGKDEDEDQKPGNDGTDPGKDAGAKEPAGTDGDEASKKSAQQSADKKPAIKELQEEYSKIEAELYKGKSKEEVEKLKAEAKKADAEKYKGKTEEEILAAKIDEYEEQKVKNLEFQLPEEQVQSAKEGKFHAIAKEIGFDVTEDTLESFKENLEKHYGQKIEQSLGKFKPEAKRLFDFLENGGTVDMFIEPHKKINDYLALSDVDLMTKELEARGWPEDKIEKEITSLTEKEELDVAAFKVRELLKASKEKITQKIIADQEKNAKLNADYKTKSVAEQYEAVKNSLNTVKEYMETPLTDKHRNYVAQKFKDGKYADILKDPKQLTDFLLYAEFGKHGIANIKTKAIHEAKMKYKMDRHNIPMKPGAGTGSLSSQRSGSASSEGNWAALPTSIAE